jgi:glutamyl-tRNA synthetase
MIVNASGKPYSKRDGDAYVGDFQTRGVLPECLFNFLALCGWAPGDDREVMTREDMKAAFELDHVTATPAQFNLEKLVWMNNQYLVACPAGTLLPLMRKHLLAGGIDTSGRDEAWMLRFTDLVKVRVRTLAELPAYAGYFFTDDVTPDPKAVDKVLRKNDGAGLKVLAGLRDVLAAVDAWTEPGIEAAITSFAAERGLGMGAVAQPLRVAVTGGTASPGIWETLALVGRERTLGRIEGALSRETRTS